MSEFGVVYSIASEIILRVIDPEGEDDYLDTVVLPEGTALYRKNKSDVLGREACPTAKTIEEYCKTHEPIKLKRGKVCAVIDSKKNEVVGSVLCCPDLYKKRLEKDKNKKSYIVLENGRGGFVGQKYNPVSGKLKVKKKTEASGPDVWVDEDEWQPAQWWMDNHLAYLALKREEFGIGEFRND